VEWFLAGTEPRGAAPAAAAGHPRIIAPVSGTVIALDPDIPAGRERLVFEARDAREPLRWVLDGDDLGAARELVVWSPTRGKHTLALIDGDARVIDRVAFEVRGPARAAAPTP
jgi:penicillin-binding protein 1C